MDGVKLNRLQWHRIISTYLVTNYIGVNSLLLFIIEDSEYFKTKQLKDYLELYDLGGHTFGIITYETACCIKLIDWGCLFQEITGMKREVIMSVRALFYRFHFL